MITLSSADSALKSFYLDAIAESLNLKTNPLLAKIERTSADVVGKDVRKIVRTGINGGIGAGTETGDLPTAQANNYKTFVTTLKNLYGTIEISDKALRASANNEGAFVNLLNEEMNALVKSASFNFGRMLFGDGTGAVATITSYQNGWVTVDNIAGIAKDMYVNLGDTTTAWKVNIIDRPTKMFRLVKEGSVQMPTATEAEAGVKIYVAGSKGNELTGLEAIFTSPLLYGVASSELDAAPYIVTDAGEISDEMIQKALDAVEENSGNRVDFIICSWGVRRALIKYFKQFDIVLPTMQIEGGFTALNFNGVPVVVDRFCPEGTMYLLNTETLKLHQLCDWQWLEAEDGKILKQTPGKPVYSATLVKYAELLCENPGAQAKISGITEA